MGKTFNGTLQDLLDLVDETVLDKETFIKNALILFDDKRFAKICDLHVTTSKISFRYTILEQAVADIVKAIVNETTVLEFITLK